VQKRGSDEAKKREMRRSEEAEGAMKRRSEEAEGAMKRRRDEAMMRNHRTFCTAASTLPRFIAFTHC